MNYKTDVLSFESIIKGRNSSVRITDDDLIYAVDLVMVFTGKDQNQSGEIIRNLLEETFSSSKFLIRKTPGKGNANTKMVALRDAIELIMVLPGKVAKETRVQFANILHRYLAGDRSMIKELEANEASEDPLHQLAQRTLPTASASMADDTALTTERKRKRELLEDRKLEAEVVALEEINRQAAVKTQEMTECVKQVAESVKQMAVDRAVGVIAQYSALSSSETIHMDERARLMFKDYLLNLLMLGQAVTNNNDGNTNTPTATPISISLVATAMGYRATTPELIKAGKEVKRRYMLAHDGQEPTKHAQMCDGRVTQVNSYMESDRALIEEVLREQMDAATTTTTKKKEATRMRAWCTPVIAHQ